MTVAKPGSWHPVALERDVLPLRLARSRIADTPLVVWRDDEDQIHVWNDRCPHRSVRLSAGRNFGSHLEGVYHGWRFGKDGRVIAVPAEGYSPRPDIRVHVVAASVQQGMVFANLSGDEAEDMTKLDVGKNDVLIRPLPIRATHDSVSGSVSRLPGLRTIVTPTGETSCWVYGWMTLNPKESALHGLRRISGRLNDLRRALESSS